VVNVLFSQPILIPSNISNIDKKVLEIKVIPGPDSEANDLKIGDWKVICKSMNL